MFEDSVFDQVTVPIPEAIGSGSGEAPIGPGSGGAAASRTDKLVQARDQKINRLGSRVGYGELDRTDQFTTIDGYQESLRNKILNDYSPYELDYLGTRLNNEYGVLETPEGLMRQSANGTLTPYEGDASDLMSYYEYGTKDGNIKRGTWGGRDPSGRYSAEYLNSKVDKNGKPDYIGETGVDINQLKRHYLLPSNVAQTYEALQHGSSQAMQNRVARYAENQLDAYRTARDSIGSGATEVYRNVDSVQPEGFDGDTLFSTVNDRFQFGQSSQRRGQTREEIANEYRQMSGQAQTEGTRPIGPGGAINRGVNVAAAAGAGITRSLLLDSAAAVASIFGQTLGTADSRREYSNELFGYDERYSQDAMKRVSDRVERMYDAKELDMNDVLAVAGDTITNPEILGESIGVLVGTVVGLGKLTKVGKAVSSVEKSYRAGALTKTQAKEAIQKINSTSSLLDKAAKLSAANIGYGATVAGMTGNAVDEFVANNEGEADVFDVLRIGAFQAAIAGVDRFAGQVALRDLPGIRSLNLFSPESTKTFKEIVSEMPPDVYAKTADSVANVLTGTAKLAGTAALEGVTEYAQTMGELFSTQYASKKYGNDFATLFEDRANQIEALTGAAIGTSMGAEMSLANTTAQTLQSGIQQSINRTTDSRTSSVVQNTETSPEAQKIVDEDYQTYANTFNKLKNQLANSKLESSSLAEHLADIEKLRRTRSAAEKKLDPNVRAKSDDILTMVEDRISELVMASPDGNLVLTRILDTPSNAKSTSSEEGVATSTVLGSRPLSSAEQQALAETAIDLIASRRGSSITPEETSTLNNFAKVNGVDPVRVERIIKSHASVENEATIEERGILGRERALDLMLGSGTTSSKRVQKAYDETSQWLGTTLTSISQLEEGIQAAEQQANTANNSARKGVKIKPVYTEYRKAIDKNGKPAYFDIQIKQENGRYVADIAQALRLIADKRRTVTGLNGLLNKFHQQAASHLDPSSVLTSGGYRIPSSTKETKGSKIETNYIKSAEKILASLPESGKVINRIILGAKPDSRWNAQGERARINNLFTNVLSKGGQYDSSDVVYVHADGKYNTKKSGETPFYNSELFKDSTPAGKEIAAAIEAGATIVLDSEYQANTPTGVLLYRYMTSNGYIPVGDISGDNSVEGSIFVPDTEDSARRLAASKERTAQLKEVADAKEKRQQPLIDLAIEEAASKIPSFKGRSTETIESDIANAIETVREDFLSLAKKQVQDTLLEGEQPTNEAVETQLVKNVRMFMQRRTAVAVRDLRLELERKGVDISDVEDLNEALRTLATADITAQVKLDEEAKVLMTAWKQASVLRLKGNELIGALNTALEPIGKEVASTAKDENTIVLRAVGDEILSNSAGSTNTVKSYAVEYEVIGIDGSVRTLIEHPKFNPEKYPVGKSTVREGKGTYKVLNINEVTHNPTDYLSVTGTTPLNTVSMDMLPAVFKRVSDRILASLKEVVPTLSPSEINITAGRRAADAEASVRRMIDSPARSLIFDKDGNISSTMTASMGIALGDLIKTDSFKLTLGKKDTQTIANMFNVSESEVTPEMRKMAQQNGTLMKSVAHNLGTSTLKALGVSKLKSNSVNRGQYERMVTDLGNLIIAIAEKEGILKTTQEKSDNIAEVYRDAETIGTDAVTYFVHLPATKGIDKTTGVFTTTLNKGAVSLSEDYALINDFMPDPTSSRKEPRFGSPIPEADQLDILSSIRNDAVGGNIPAVAKETLRSFMNTPYVMDLDNVSKFLSELKTKSTRNTVLKSLGYITISDKNPEYVKLPFADKEIQEAINRDVENSIALVEEYYNAIQNGLPNEMYFPFYYTSNHRYMLNSNTLNGQADKLHRFFVHPKAHNVEYSVDRIDNSFTYNYVQEGEPKSIDSSLYIRAALSQAMGIDIDKSATSEIVRIGNDLLSMSLDDVETARKSMLDTGTFTMAAGNNSVTFEPAHLSHGLQGLEFLRKYKSTNAKVFTDALSAEYDALTSGFSNKMQQFGLTANRSEDFRRVGIVEPTNNTAELFQSTGVGVNDMLSDKSLLDSYKNLAKDTILDLNRQVEALPPKQAKLFDAISGLLPGADQRAVDPNNVTISSALRGLFKPGFMIFNYSAGINRITTNLGEEMVAQMFKDLAESDFKSMTLRDKALTAEQKSAAEAIAALVYVAPEKPLGISLTELQRRIRSEPISSLQTMGQVYSKGQLVERVRPLDQVLIKEIISPTYGASVQESFTKNFSEFIDIQNATNDAFKLSFAVFGNLLQQRVTEYRATTNNAPISEEQMLTMIGELREAFPVIAGPLSDSLQDGVYVYTTETRTPKGTLATTVSPALRYAEGAKAKSRSLNPLVRSIVAAANAGAVLPFHALDGAQMSRMTNEFVRDYTSKIEGFEKGAGLLPVHDAIIPPLPFSDILGHMYNKNTVELNSTYSVIGEIQKMTQRVQKILSGEDSELKVDVTKIPSITSLSFINRKVITENTAEVIRLERELKKLQSETVSPADIAEKKVELKNAKEAFSFNNSFNRVKDNVKIWNDRVEQQRATMFVPGTKVGVLVTTPGGVFTVGQNEVDLSYLDDLKASYRQTSVNVAPTADTTSSNTESTIYMTPDNLRVDPKYRSRVNDTNQTITSESIITVLVNDKLVGGRDKPLSEAELEAVETSWTQTIAVAINALGRDATLVFSNEAVTTTDLGDDAVNGESYVYNRIMETGDYTVTPIEADGVITYRVSKASESDFVTLIDDTTDVIIPELDSVTNRNGFKNAVNKYKNHSKRCK